MKRLALILVMLVIFCSSACADGWMDFGEYAERLSALTDAEWKETGDIYMLELEEDVTVSVCLDRGEVVAVTVETPVGDALNDYAYAAFDAAGLLSDETLARLSELVEEGETQADYCVIYRLIGELRECFAICLEEQAEAMVWQSVHGGEKWHDIPTCSGMDVPRLVTVSAAEDLGYDSCGLCAD